ncbi:MAG TPA: YaaR family protein [Bacillota bacterium]|nr:YaaR family protein [Bacillota bacterium]
MKINQDMGTQIDAKTRHVPPFTGEKTSFDRMIQSHAEQIKQQELQRLMDDITIQGEKLARFRSFRDLAKFKRMIKQFLQETVSNGLDLKNEHSFSMTGHSRKLATVKEVDQKLFELTESLLDQEKRTVDLLSVIGEIKGLLISLYT